jgi:exosome complex RNA-binding protein Csl4
MATDVALQGGVLVGQVSDSNGVAQAAVPVSLQTVQGDEVFATVTDQQGIFHVQNVRPGVYQIVTPQARRLYRLWASGTAPMSAKPAAMVVGDTVRGSLGGTISTHPVLTAVVVCGVATAIAVPVALTLKHKSG